MLSNCLPKTLSLKSDFNQKFLYFAEKFKAKVGHEVSTEFKNFIKKRINFEVKQASHLVRCMRRLHDFCESKMTEPNMNFNFNDLD